MIKINFSKCFFCLIIAFCSRGFCQDYSKAWDLINSDHYDDAITLLQKNKNDPSWTYSNVLIGLAYFYKSDYSDSCSNLEQYFSTTKDDPLSFEYSMALLYAMRAENKVLNSDKVKFFYSKFNDKAITGFDNKLLEAITFADITNKKIYPLKEAKQGIAICNRGISILEGLRPEGEKKPWFYNTYARELISRQGYYKDPVKQVSELKQAVKCFNDELKNNKDSLVYINLSITTRLLGEQAEWSAMNKKITPNRRKYFLQEAEKCYQQAIDYINTAKTAENVDNYPTFLPKVEKITLQAMIDYKKSLGLKSSKNDRKKESSR